MHNNNLSPNEAVNDAQALAAAVDTALAELNDTVFCGLNALERVDDFAAQLMFDLEQRVWPLLAGRAGDQQRAAGEFLGALEQPLRGLADPSFCGLLEKLTFRATNRSFVDKQNAHHRALRDLADAARPKPQDTP